MLRAQVRPVKNHEEFRECERIQKAVWGAVGVAAEAMSVTQKYGGAVLGAFVGGHCVGFLYAFLARRRGRLIHWSHLMAVESAFRNLGLGFRMKLAHRQFALAQGLPSICWTYDPLQSRNAVLNLHRLGGRAEEYLPNCYGSFQSNIEQGLPSDRLVVDWRINSSAVARRLQEGCQSADEMTKLLALPRVNKTRFRQVRRGSFPENCTIRLGLRHRSLLVEIPTNTDAMRLRALKLAWRWRMETRRIFQHYFAAGYTVVECVPPTATNEGRCFYVMRRSRHGSGWKGIVDEPSGLECHPNE